MKQHPNVLHSLETFSSNYPIAWELLKNKFENTRLIINKYVNSLFNYSNMEKDSAISIRQFLDHTNNGIRVLKTLGQPKEHWDTLLVHLSLNKLSSV